MASTLLGLADTLLVKAMSMAKGSSKGVTPDGMYAFELDNPQGHISISNSIKEQAHVIFQYQHMQLEHC